MFRFAIERAGKLTRDFTVEIGRVESIFSGRNIRPS
jgi:hypothetical protein